MELSKSDLKKRYRALDDNEIMDLYIDGGLTEQASKVLKEEMEIRRLTPEHAKQRENEYIQEVIIDEVKLKQLVYELEGNQNLSLAILSGAIAAGFGAAVWALVTVQSGYKFGIMALTVGGFVAFAVRIFGKGITNTFGIVGAIFSLLGCIAGGLLSSCAYISKYEEIPYFDVLTQINLQIIIEIIVKNFDYIDLLFYAIAVSVGYNYSFRKLTEEELARISKE